MDWEAILMDPVVQGSIITAAVAVSLAALAGFFKIVLSFRDKKPFDEIKTKIGNHRNDTLERQHESIEKTIVEKTINLAEKQNNIFNKVDNIDKEMAASREANKERYSNLNLDQRDIRDNVNKLVYDWERTNLENKELKGRITELEKRIGKLEMENKELITLLNKSKRRNKNMEL